MSTVALKHLLSAYSPGGVSVLTSVAPLGPTVDSRASVTSAKYRERKGKTSKSIFVYKRRFWNKEAATAILIGSKQSRSNRLEAAVSAIIANQDPVLARTPHIELRSKRAGKEIVYNDLGLSHRAFDRQIRGDVINGEPATETQEYRGLRDATVNHAYPLLERSLITFFFGGRDASRRNHQEHYRSTLVGEIIGTLANQGRDPEVSQFKRGRTRVDPLGARIQPDRVGRKAITDAQREELSRQTYDNPIGKGEKEGLARPGIEVISPSLEQLDGVTCQVIIRFHMLSFAALRVLHFDSPTPGGDVACRALLAAFTPNGLTCSDVELLLRVNRGLVGVGPAVVALDRCHGQKESFEPLSVDQTQDLLSAAIGYAVQVANLSQGSFILNVKSNPVILTAATDDAQDG